MEEEEIKKDYYSIGSREDIVISNSSLSWLNPIQGGSPQKFLSFFDKQEEKQESKSLENGKIVHLYAQTPEQFAIATINKPDGQIGAMCEEFYRLICEPTVPEGIDITITSNLKTETGRQAEILEIKAAYEKLSQLIQIDLNSTIGLFKIARSNTNSYKSYGEKTLIDKFISECIEYFKQLGKLRGKLTLTTSDKLIIENCVKSLKGNPVINKYFNLGGLFQSNLIFKEVDIYFNLLGINCKARLDNIYIDIENRKIYITDLKTTSKPLSLFQDTLEYYRYYRQLAFYRKALRWLIINKKLVVGDIPDLEHFDIICQLAVVETTGNFDCDMFELSLLYVDKGNSEIKSLFERFIFHKTNNIWNKSMESVAQAGTIKLIPKI